MPVRAADPKLTRPVAIFAGFAGSLVAAGALLWVHYGTAVFFELVRAGWAACFG
jgi:hypothetical protein